MPEHVAHVRSVVVELPAHPFVAFCRRRPEEMVGLVGPNKGGDRERTVGSGGELRLDHGRRYILESHRHVTRWAAQIMFGYDSEPLLHQEPEGVSRRRFESVDQPVHGAKLHQGVFLT
jgi:hypothetical protein